VCLPAFDHSVSAWRISHRRPFLILYETLTAVRFSWNDHGYSRRMIRLATLLSVLAAVALPGIATAAGTPTATTGNATEVSPTAATVHGSLNPNGLVTTWYFQFGKTKKYGARTPAQDAGSGTKAVQVSSTLTNLAANTTYHYRLVATNSAGSKQGADRTFKTPQQPTVSTIAAAPNPAVFGSLVAVSGFLIGPNGGGGKEVALEGNAFPFTAGFAQIGNSVVTADNGGYQFFFTPVTNTQLRVVDRTNPKVVSPVVTQDVAIRVSLNASRRGRHGRARFSGHVTPAGAASVVLIQRHVKGGWKNVGSPVPKTKTGATSSSFRSRKLKVRPGVFRAVARPGDGAHVEGVSRGKRVRRH
jgi:hypothetical protein